MTYSKPGLAKTFLTTSEGRRSLFDMMSRRAPSTRGNQDE